MPDEPNIEPPNTAQLPQDTYRILILDSTENVEKFKNACKNAGHSVVPAHTGEEALAFLDGTDHADVIVCAAHMESESIFEFLHRVKGDERYEGVATLIVELEPGPMAVKLSKSTERAGKAIGADAFITMPEFNATELIAKLEQLLPSLPSREQDPTASNEPAKSDAT